MSETHSSRNNIDGAAASEGNLPDALAPSDRARWISELARSDGGELRNRMMTHLQQFGEPAWEWLRAPEIGLVMTRGRIGGEGAPFNLGEATVTRCALALSSGEEGHAVILGRDGGKARLAALADALMQTEASTQISRGVIEPLTASRRARESQERRRSAETKVEFFTLVRGEDQ